MLSVCQPPSSFSIHRFRIFDDLLFLLHSQQGESLYKFFGISNVCLTFRNCQGGSPNDNGESDPIPGAYKTPNVCGSFVIDHSFTLRSSAFVDKEIGVAEYDDLRDVHNYGTQIESNYFVHQSSGRYGHACCSLIQQSF